jgi:hypothetical protein
VARHLAYSPRPYHGDHPPCRHGFPTRGAYSHFEPSCFDGPHFLHRGSRPTRSNGEMQRIVKTSSGHMIKCWIPKIFLTNPSARSHRYSLTLCR